MNHKGKWTANLCEILSAQQLASKSNSSPHIKQPLLIDVFSLLRVCLGLGVINEPPAHDLLKFGRMPPASGILLPLVLAPARCYFIQCHLLNSPCGSLTTHPTIQHSSILLINIYYIIRTKAHTWPARIPTLGFDLNRPDHTGPTIHYA